MRLVWAPLATADLDDLWAYLVGQASVERADATILKIVDTAKQLGEWPKSGPPRDNIRSGMRSLAVPPYVIFYRIKSNDVEVVRVLHGRRDLDPTMFPPLQ